MPLKQRHKKQVLPLILFDCTKSTSSVKTLPLKTTTSLPVRPRPSTRAVTIKRVVSSAPRVVSESTFWKFEGWVEDVDQLLYNSRPTTAPLLKVERPKTGKVLPLLE